MMGVARGLGLGIRNPGTATKELFSLGVNYLISSIQQGSITAGKPTKVEVIIKKK